MNPQIRPRRSVLYMPATNKRAMDKARQLDVDAVIFDLEDAVAPEARAEARRQACDQVREGGYGSREVLIRINGTDTPWSDDDLVAAVAARPDGIVLPKVGTAASAAACVARIRELGADIPLWPMIETPEGVSNVDEIAAVDGVAVLVMGTNDLIKELRAINTPDRHALIYALSRTVNAARRYGRDALDGVSQVLNDPEALTAVCRQGRELGFDGKTLVHPAQIGPTNAVFGPDEQAVEQATRIIQAWEQAEAEGRGVAVLDGKMIESLHAAEARRLVAFDQAIKAR